MSSDLFADVMSASAASSASDAARASRAAQAASEERLESSGHNPFAIFGVLSFENIPSSDGGLFSFFGAGSKQKISGVRTKLSVKRTDISHLSEKRDDFGTPYTVVYLEERSRLFDVENACLYVAGTLADVQQYINSL
jgi:hypothetical protein